MVKLLGEFKSAEMDYAKMGSKLEQSSSALNRKRSREQEGRIKEGESDGCGALWESLGDKAAH